MSTFQLVGIESQQFAPLFDLPDAELAANDIVRRIADSDRGFPCRISLQDAAIGDELLLLHYTHHPVASPYRASGPIYVRRGQTQRIHEPGAVPDYVTRRVISVRVYDAKHMMLGAEIVDGTAAADVLHRLFNDPQAAYVHLHNASRGCFLCVAKRV